MTGRGNSTGRARALALVSLVASLATAVAVLVFLARHGLYVVSGLFGLALTLASGWWVISRDGVQRVLGAVGAAVGLAVFVVSLVRVGNNTEGLLWRAVVVAGLAALAVLAARAAISEGLAEEARRTMRPVAPPAHPVLLCNPWSGGGKVQRFGLVDLATSLGVRTALLDHGIELDRLARDALDDGADCIGMAGGDGSQALVASLAVQRDVPFVCVTAGTRNHFALDLGLDRDDPRGSLYAFSDPVERRVDYATVNDRFFVNNVSLGIYATLVQQPGYRDAKAGTTKRLLPQLLGETDEPFDLQFVTPDGVSVDGAFLIQVSNNPYVLGASLDVSQRRRLDSGRLGVFAVSATTGAQAAQVVLMAMAGRSSSSGHAYEFTTERFEVRSRSGTALVGVDGEALELETPLRFEIHPLGLRIFVPKDSVKTTVRRQAHDVHIKDLVPMVRGQPAPSR